MRLTLFKMFQTCVDDSLDTVQLGAPCLFGIIESVIDGIESFVHVGPQIADPRIQITETGIIDEDSHEHGERGHTNRQRDLNGLISHRCIQNTAL